MPPRRGWNVGGLTDIETGVVSWLEDKNALNVMLSALEKPVAPFPTAWMDTGSPPYYRTQTCQLLSTLSPIRSLSRNAGLLVSYTNYLTPPQTTFAASLKQHTNLSFNHVTPPVSTPSYPPPSFTLAPAALTIFVSLSTLLLKKATVLAENFSIS